MNGLESGINELIDACYGQAKQKGFWDVPAGIQPTIWGALKRAEKIALLHSELSETLEAVRKPQESEKLPGFTLEEEELADVAIRLFDYCGGFNIRLADAIKAKMAYNANRPHRHGKAF